MIQLQKLAEPQVLVLNGPNWTQDIVTKIAAGEELTNTEKTRYRNPQIKAVLVQETCGKCAYCESKLLHIHHGDVEHIVPKSLRPELTVEWDNLTLACEICNQNKSNRDPNAEHIIDPYVSNPADHLLFIGPLVFPKGTVTGTSTRSILDLNRGELNERRRERLLGLMAIVEQVLREDLPMAARRAIYLDLVANEASRATAYSAMANSVLEHISASLPTEITTG
ncbi:HNH endonuclease [Rhizobium tumorigenes]|uniref:HNH endonuclease n=1 Tax=Rhizobium tumorigenes TaxID=2041385 RepID=UPI00241FC203|nr:HNH endonuclease signature motif containing protein [Rhizobium tumorigenes]WFS02367.1 HNH endonuclease signature motif containing protein [Rhizobium tumorigenes]